MRPRRPRRRSRLRPVLVGLGVVVFGAAAFLAGLGRALEEGDADSGLRTQVRTLTPTGLPPARATVTVRLTVRE